MTQTLAELAPEYRRLFLAMVPTPADAPAFKAIAARLDHSMPIYKAVEDATGVPAAVIAVIHNRESDADFTTHLHNGDPLTARTYHVPAGRPPVGSPPFSWAESAIDALRYEGLTGLEWTVEQACFQLERYNGFGYRQYHNEPSPYLWAGTNVQQPGKYTADGQFNRTAYDTQLGTVPLLVALWDLEPQERLPFYGAAKPPTPTPAPEPPPAPVPTPEPPSEPVSTPVVAVGIFAALAAAVAVASADISSLFRGILHVLFGS